MEAPSPLFYHLVFLFITSYHPYISTLFFPMSICSQLSFLSLSPYHFLPIYLCFSSLSMYDLLVSLSVLLLNLCAPLPPLSFPCASFYFQPSLSGPFLFLSIFSSFIVHSSFLYLLPTPVLASTDIQPHFLPVLLQFPLPIHPFPDFL